MGSFLSPPDMKQRTSSALVKSLEVDDLDDRFIIPAERAIEAAFALDLDTDNAPRAWASVFATRPDLQQRFEDDYRRATIILVNRMADNPQDYVSRSVGGASVVYAHGLPAAVGVLIGPWTASGGGDMSGRIFRG